MKVLRKSLWITLQENCGEAVRVECPRCHREERPPLGVLPNYCPHCGKHMKVVKCVAG